MAPMLARRCVLILAFGAALASAGCKSPSYWPSPAPRRDSSGEEPGGGSALTCTYDAKLNACVADTTSSFVSGVVLDARTGQPATGTIIVNVLDDQGFPSAASVGANGKLTNGWVMVGGMLVLGLDFRATPLPTTLNMVASGDGYNTNSTRILVRPEDLDASGQYRGNFTIRVVDVANPPAGVSPAQGAGTADASGTTSAPVVVMTPAAPGTGQVEVSVPSGTAITTTDGKPLSGALQATVTYYSNSESRALSTFPGGLSDFAVTMSSGMREEGLFVSGGFAAVQLTDASGKVAAKFANPVTLAVTIPATTVNPITHLPVKAGETIPFWTYNENTGQWSADGDVTLEDDGTGNFLAKKTVTHFSYFASGWFEKKCAVSPTITITGNESLYPLDIEVEAKPGFWDRRKRSGANVNTFALSDIGAPGGKAVQVTAYYNGQDVGSVWVKDACEAGTYTLPVNIPVVQPATLKVSVQRVCSNDPTRTSPVEDASAVLFAGAGTEPSYATTDANGNATFGSLAAGATYDVTVALLLNDPLKKSATLRPGENTLEFLTPIKCDLPPTVIVKADQAPVITSLLVPSRVLTQGESMTMVAKAMDPDGDALSYAWSYSCIGDAQLSLGAPTAASTSVAAISGTGTCTISVEASANGLKDFRQVDISVAGQQSYINVLGTFVPFPVIVTVTLGDPARCTVSRTEMNATCSGRVTAGTPVLAGFSFDGFVGPPSTTATVSDNCGGSTPSVFVDEASGTGVFGWIPPSKSSVCILSVKIARDTLHDEFPIAVFVADK